MEQLIDLTGRVGFVTGASRGIGREIAMQMARRGARVALVSRSESDARDVAASLVAEGLDARGYACDVADTDSVNRVGDAVLSEFGGVDFVVNNAGITRDKLLLRMSPDDWNAVVSVNLTGAYNVVRKLVPQLIKQRSGRIVNITSVIGQIGNAGQANYAASKAGIIGLTRSLAKELAARGITVNAVAPGYIETAMTDDLSDEAREKMRAMIPLRRFGSARDVAMVVLFLLSDLASYTTGQVLNCDGGMVMA